MHINIFTLFPEMFPGTLGYSLSKKALDQNIWSYKTVNIRDFTTDNHGTVDDTPYGGGAGMVMKPDIIESALLSVSNEHKNVRNIYMSPRGKVLDQNLVKELSSEKEINILCGRYEGVDQRLLDAHSFEEISIGDYVLSGGEQAAIILIDACVRLLPGVMGNAETATEESFSNVGLLEYPHYTRPAEWRSATGNVYNVPDILRSGDHTKIKKWRHEKSIEITKNNRPDLWYNYQDYSS